LTRPSEKKRTKKKTKTSLLWGLPLSLSLASKKKGKTSRRRFLLEKERSPTAGQEIYAKIVLLLTEK